MTSRKDLLLPAIEQRTQEVRARLKACKKEFSEESVRDLRVASRRLLAALDLGRSFSNTKAMQKARRSLKSFFDDLDDLRDTQVLLVDSAELLESFPLIKNMVKQLQKQEQKLLVRANEQIKKSRFSETEEYIQKIQLELNEQTRAGSFHAALLNRIDEAYAQIAQLSLDASAADITGIHRLRIAFKKFRYMVEIVSPKLPVYPAQLFEQMHAYQRMMGDIQDADLLVQALVDYAKRSSRRIKPAHDFVQKNLHKLVATFLTSKSDSSTFWRLTPDEKFPWEKPDETLHRSSRNRARSGLSRSRSRQPEVAQPEGPKEDAQDRPRTEGTGESSGSDSNQPLPEGAGNSPDSGQGI